MSGSPTGAMRELVDRRRVPAAEALAHGLVERPPRARAARSRPRAGILPLRKPGRRRSRPIVARGRLDRARELVGRDLDLDAHARFRQLGDCGGDGWSAIGAPTIAAPRRGSAAAGERALRRGGRCAGRRPRHYAGRCARSRAASAPTAGSRDAAVAVAVASRGRARRLSRWRAAAAPRRRAGSAELVGGSARSSRSRSAARHPLGVLVRDRGARAARPGQPRR